MVSQYLCNGLCSLAVTSSLFPITQPVYSAPATLASASPHMSPRPLPLGAPFSHQSLPPFLLDFISIIPTILVLLRNETNGVDMYIGTYLCLWLYVPSSCMT